MPVTDYIIYFALCATFAFLLNWLVTQKVVPYFCHRKNLAWLDNTFKQDCYAVFQQLFSKCNTFREASIARHHWKLDSDSSFTYGEINFIAFAKILEAVNPQPGELMVDLGSGAGKAVFCAALLYPEIKVVGVELLPGLTACSANLLKRFEQLMAKHPRLATHSYNIEFIQNNLLNISLSQASIIFVNATCYDEKFLSALADSLSVLASGSRVIITTHPLTHKAFSCRLELSSVMSWGLCNVRIYQRL
jgi:SAM-dependent methyltransferase